MLMTKDNISLNYIALSKLDSICVGELSYEETIPDNYIASLNAELMRLGYIINKEDVDKLKRIPVESFKSIYNDILQTAKHLKGDDFTYKPMYPNFPKQVMDMDEAELYLNAIFHYFTYGNWKPEYEKIKREFSIEDINYTSVGIISERDVIESYDMFLYANDSLSENDVNILNFYLENYSDVIFPLKKTPDNKEVLSVVLSYMLKNDMDISKYVKSATDVLRLVSYISGGDVSLADNTKFKSLPRGQRRKIVRSLENVIKEEDIKRHSNKWVKLAHNLHVGDYSKKVYDIIKKPRENETLDSIYTKIEEEIENGNYKEAASYLMQSPGDFARRLDSLLRNADDINLGVSIAKKFFDDSVISSVSTRVLYQVYNHFKVRNSGGDRIIFPKGSSSQTIRNIGPYKGKIDENLVSMILLNIKSELTTRFSNYDKLGKSVWIDPALKNIPMPFQQRSASESLRTFPRGATIPIDKKDVEKKNTLRLFLHWIGQDIDLSAIYLGNGFAYKGHTSYTNLRDSNYGVYHSGDITYAPAPDGAAEFIDIDLNKLKKKEVRYIVMGVYCYSGGSFSKQNATVGWMFRENPLSNEIFKPSTVDNRIFINNESTTNIPVILDIEKLELTYLDLTLRGDSNIFRPSPISNSNIFKSFINHSGNNVETNLDAMTVLLNNLMHVDKSCYDLFEMHAMVRSDNGLVSTKEEADFTIGIDDCDFNIYDVNKINSEFLD